MIYYNYTFLYFTHTGISFNYFLQQTFIWALLHAVFLFWGVNFPYSYRHLRISGRIRHAHIISVLLALILPLPGALAPLKDGFLTTPNPPVFCIGRNIDFVFYFTALPLSFVGGAISCLFALTSWKIFKVGRLNRAGWGGTVIIRWTPPISAHSLLGGGLNRQNDLFYKALCKWLGNGCHVNKQFSHC